MAKIDKKFLLNNPELLLEHIEHLEYMLDGKNALIKAQADTIKLYQKNPELLNLIHEANYMKYNAFYNIALKNKEMWPVATYLN